MFGSLLVVGVCFLLASVTWACPRCRRAGGGHQRHPLPLPGAVPASARAGGRQAQHHHRPGVPYIRPNHHLSLKSQEQMERLFRQCPEAVANTLRIAEQCAFNLGTDLGYTLPEPAVPDGYTAESYLRRYGSVSKSVEERLEEEFRLIKRHRLAGFLLLYREVVLLAQKIMEEKGMAHPGIPLEERPLGRDRGSSVALLAGCLQTARCCATEAVQFRLNRMLIPSAQVYMLPARWPKGSK